MSRAIRCDLHGHGSPIAGWVAAHIPGCEDGFSDNYSMAIWRGDVMIAGVVFHNYYPQAGVVEMSAAAVDPRWLTKRTLYRIHDFAFTWMGCQLVVMRVSEHNARMRSIARRYGYTETIIPRLRGRDEAEIIYTLPDDVWHASKWGTHGKT